MVDAVKLLDRYKLEERIASGGMGTVYVATDERLGRRVAIKLLKEDLAGDPRFVERFRREARAVAALAHPNIANVFDYGQDEGHHFIVMEYVNGEDLARLMASGGRLSEDRSVALVAQACDALQQAHAAGVVHRDVKPANIMVADDDRVKVTDFGIARAVGDSTLTATGSVLGTAHYLSPEQASGGVVTPASDIYAMGVVLYEMLTGVTPFAGDSPIAIAMQHISDELPRPSIANPDVSAPLDAVVAKATAKEPQQRFETAAEMAAALRDSTGATVKSPVAAPFAGGPAETHVMGPSGTETQPLSEGVWPVSGARWSPKQLGRAVLLVLGGLALVAILLLAFNLATGDEDSGRSARQDQPNRSRGNDPPENPPPPENQPDEPAGLTLDDYSGRLFDEVEESLEAQGLEVDGVEAPSGAPEDTIVGQDPAAGTELFEGDTVVLTVSTGETDEGDEESDEEGEDGAPGEGQGKAKGEGKAKGKDDD